MYLIFDTETTGLPKRYDAPISDSANWPRFVQIAWQLHDDRGRLVEHLDFIVRPEGFDIPFDAEQVHGISTALAEEKGIPLNEGLKKFNAALNKTKFIVGQNLGFDVKIMGAEFYRAGMETPLMDLPVLDTCTEKTADLCQIPGGRGGKYKLPNLTELHEKLFEEPFAEAHNATADVEATARCFLELVRRRLFTREELDAAPDYFENFVEVNPEPFKSIGLEHTNLKKASHALREKEAEAGISFEKMEENREALREADFVHLHNHTQFSVLQSTISFEGLVDNAVNAHMPAVAMTDTGNMMGAFEFVTAVNKYNASLKKDGENGENGRELKAIVGAEFNVCEDHTDKSHKDNGYQVVFLAKNKNGYKNMVKMSSLAFTEGFYYVPRIDKTIIEQYKEDVMVLTGNLNGEVPGKILNVGEKQADEALLWWKNQFGDDLYIELMRHDREDEDRVNETLVKFAEKHDVKLVATNNTYYATQDEANAHDVLLCVKDGELQSTPIGRGRGYRYGLPNDEYYFKATEEMKTLFRDIPEAITTTTEVADKVEPFELARDVLLPEFAIPEKFRDEKDKDDHGKRGENAYLKHLTFEGAKTKYDEITPELKERIAFELDVIAQTGYPGYFLIVEDFIRKAKHMGVSVGPGRGSAAGSAVAYCLDITTVDPIKYDLLFERFLNPERISMPDIDIDFDDEGRGLVMKYVIDKYGADQVAQIITYGKMKAKSAIRDTARVLDLPLNDADRLAKLIPDMTSFSKIFDKSPEALKENFRPEDLDKINELLQLSEGEDAEAEVINQARILEGSLRNTGVHACGVIITPSNITNFVPVSLAKDSDLYLTQFDNHVVEDAGLLKMDFLGLKTLTLIKDTVEIIKARHDKELKPDEFPLDDEKTYQLFQRGETVGIFQYESPGMQKHLRNLKPSVFEDLIAMNALYRPGPMEYIPSFIKRKHGEEEITYDLPEMEEILEETYGITVYQEQVMLLSRKLANFTRGEADRLRKAMGKKKFKELEVLKPKFFEGGQANGHSEGILEKIWKDWEAFASYAFNKSHSTCYAWVAYQTAYLKAHYPAEYMAAVLSNNMDDIKKVSFFMEACKSMGLEVLGPDVNESFYKFSVNKNDAIRFGMGAVKGVGHNAVKTIVENRKEEGPYRSIFDLAKRIDLRAANKKSFENLALAGGFDSFTPTHRAQYFYQDEREVSFLEKVIKFANKYQENQNSSQVSLFGEASEVQIPEPEVPPCEEWPTLTKLKKEKEVVGIYISGHPLDDFKSEMKHFCRGTIGDFNHQEDHLNRELSVGGIVTDVKHLTSKMGKGFGIFTVEDYNASYEFKIFGEDYLKYRHFLMPNNFIFMKIFIREGFVNRNTGKRSAPRVQYRDFRQLQDIMDDFSKKLTIQLDVNDLKNENIDELETLVKSHKGEQTLNFVVYELKDRLKVHMPSRRQKVKVCSELLEELEAANFHYRVN